MTSEKIIPFGIYAVEVVKLELAADDSGKPLFIGGFKIVDGEYEGELLEMRQIVTEGFHIHSINNFLRDLVECCEVNAEVRFDSFNQYGHLLQNIFNQAHNAKIALEYSDNKMFYSTFEITGKALA